MNIYQFGNAEAQIVLIQAVDEHDLQMIENEVDEIGSRSNTPFRLLAVQAADWNRDLSPWPAPAVFGKADFGGCAAKMLSAVLSLCEEKEKTYYLGGYSLAGLFALWAASQTDAFAGIAAASPSVWFPGFIPYMKENRILADAVYLSLGNKEEKTRNPVMSTVGDCIREAYHHLQQAGIDCALEWNQGNHFQDAEIRTAKAFAWLLNRSSVIVVNRKGKSV